MLPQISGFPATPPCPSWADFAESEFLHLAPLCERAINEDIRSDKLTNLSAKRRCLQGVMDCILMAADFAAPAFDCSESPPLCLYTLHHVVKMYLYLRAVHFASIF